MNANDPRPHPQGKTVFQAAQAAANTLMVHFAEMVGFPVRIAFAATSNRDGTGATRERDEWRESN